MLILGMVTSSIVVISVAAFIFYRHILKTLRDNEIKELLEGNKCQNDKSYKDFTSLCRMKDPARNSQKKIENKFKEMECKVSN